MVEKNKSLSSADILLEGAEFVRSISTSALASTGGGLSDMMKRKSFFFILSFSIINS